MVHPLQKLVAAQRRGERIGITSVCSAHPLVIEAALLLAKETGRAALIEATCNQVNQDGGYTGMTPRDFRGFVEAIAHRIDFDISKIILGGDHLGPNPWKNLAADEAMAKAETMIAAYAQAGFTKLHLDTSMGCAGEPIALADETTAARAAQLAAVAEANKGAVDPVYVIGTEVPVPGGAAEALDHLEVTNPASVKETYSVHETAFGNKDLQDAFGRVVALVVQPGVEFGHSDVVHYDRAAARELTASLADLPGIVFEAHSTDYQTADGLRSLVEDGFAILKVGPWVTFALREALYAIDAVADVLDGTTPTGRLMATMDRVMRDRPENWQKYYEGTEQELWLQRHFSLSDRIRYYWPDPAASQAVDRLYERVTGKTAPLPVAHQFFPWIDTDAETDSVEIGPSAVIASVQKVLKMYAVAEGL